jgi:C1A family cysteine protease
MSVQLWKVLVPALGLSLLWTACKKEESATLPEEQSSNEARYTGTVEDDPALVNKAPLLLSADFIATVRTARKGGGGKPGNTTPIDTTTTTTPPPTDTTTITPPPSTDTTIITQPGVTLPASYLIAMPSVRHQGTEGSCVSFAVTYARACEQYYKTRATSYNDAVNVFSPEYVFNQAGLPDCSGSAVTSSLDLLKNTGVCTWQSMPYSTNNGCSVAPDATQNAEAANYKIASYNRVIDSDQLAIKTMIASNHAVIASFTIDGSFKNAYPGFIWKSLTGNSGSHTMAICGYDDAKHAYKAINSWGTGWGDAGYIWIDYDFFPVAASYYAYVMTL